MSSAHTLCPMFVHCAEAWRRSGDTLPQFSHQNHISSRIFIDLLLTRSAAAGEGIGKKRIALIQQHKHI